MADPLYQQQQLYNLGGKPQSRKKGKESGRSVFSLLLAQQLVNPHSIFTGEGKQEMKIYATL